ncbi:MAG: M48 family metalloprotease, partial [Rickettsiales bacterium]|nr:M48 family metalloprotease [Rickettsiales bacterium]
MAAPISVHDHIRENNRRTALLLLLFPLSFVLLAFAIVAAGLFFIEDKNAIAYGQSLMSVYAPLKYAAGFPILYAAAGYAAVAAVPIIALTSCWIAVSYFFGDRMMLGFSGATPLPEDWPGYRQARRSAENVALAAGIPTPALYVINDSSLNAFATGHTPGTSSIALTSGMIEKLSKDELEGVIAHEIAHIKNRDVRLNMLVITGFGVLAFLANAVMRIIRSAGNSNRGGSSQKNGAAAILILFGIWLLLVIFNLVVGPIINMAVSRSQEYQADATAALFTRNPKALADALAKIKPDPVVEALRGNRTMGVACIAYPHEGKSFS